MHNKKIIVLLLIITILLMGCTKVKKIKQNDGIERIYLNGKKK